MGRNLFVIILTILLSWHSEAAHVSVKEGPENLAANPLKYIGTSKNLVGLTKSGAEIYQESYYYVSQNAAAWQGGKADCESFLGEGASLVYIETQDELKNVTRFLQDGGDTINRVWIGGKYDTGIANFAWENGVRLGPWAPWASGHPNTKTSITRVSLTAIGDVKFETQFQTLSNRYLCELRSSLDAEEATPCYNNNDLVIVVDSSGSIGQDNYRAALEFTAKLAVAWADNPGNRLAVAIFSNSVETLFSFADSLTIAGIRSRIYNAHYLAGGTSSDLGLDRAISELSWNARAVPKNLVFLTDGESNYPDATLAAAQRVYNAGIRSFSVGIGSYYNPSELLAIAGYNSANVFTTSDFNELLKLLQPVSRRVCV